MLVEVLLPAEASTRPTKRSASSRNSFPKSRDWPSNSPHRERLPRSRSDLMFSAIPRLHRPNFGRARAPITSPFAHTQDIARHRRVIDALRTLPQKLHERFGAGPARKLLPAQSEHAGPEFSEFDEK